MRDLKKQSKSFAFRDKKHLSHLLDNTARSLQDDLVNFLKELISIPSNSCNEEAVIMRTKAEMEKVGFDEIEIDHMGNLIGRIGKGKRIIAMDAHLDTVGPGDMGQWKMDPLKGTVLDGKVFGLGAVDQKAGMASMVYGVKLIKELGLLSDYTLYVVGSVQEEDCDGLCWRYIIERKEIRPHCVVITEPTNLNINIGHRGRMEIDISVMGKSAHGSMPHLGENAIYSMAKIIQEVEALNHRLKEDSFLGKGSVTVSHISSKAPSFCSVPHQCTIHLDRRLTLGESREEVLAEIHDIINKTGVRAKVTIPQYSRNSYRDSVYPAESYFPTWKLSQDHKLLSAAKKTYQEVFGREPEVGKWIFSTNGVATMGVHGIPTLGFGPGEERLAHSPNECVPIDHLVKAACWYALFPKKYVEIMEDKEVDDQRQN